MSRAWAPKIQPASQSEQRIGHLTLLPLQHGTEQRVPWKKPLEVVVTIPLKFHKCSVAGLSQQVYFDVRQFSRTVVVSRDLHVPRVCVELSRGGVEP
jgi:hypothetical protein